MRYAIWLAGVACSTNKAVPFDPAEPSTESTEDSSTTPVTPVPTNPTPPPTASTGDSGGTTSPTVPCEVSHTEGGIDDPVDVSLPASVCGELEARHYQYEPSSTYGGSGYYGVKEAYFPSWDLDVVRFTAIADGTVTATIDTDLDGQPFELAWYRVSAPEIDTGTAFTGPDRGSATDGTMPIEVRAGERYEIRIGTWGESGSTPDPDAPLGPWQLTLAYD